MSKNPPKYKYKTKTVWRTSEGRFVRPPKKDEKNYWILQGFKPHKTVTQILVDKKGTIKRTLAVYKEHGFTSETLLDDRGDKAGFLKHALNKSGVSSSKFRNAKKVTITMKGISEGKEIELKKSISIEKVRTPAKVKNIVLAAMLQYMEKEKIRTNYRMRLVPKYKIGYKKLEKIKVGLIVKK